MSLWDKMNRAFDDGIDDLLDAGMDRAAKEIAPKPDQDKTAQPKTAAKTQDIGRNSDGTRVTQDVTKYPVGGQLISGISNTKLALAGGAVLVLGVAFVMYGRGHK